MDRAFDPDSQAFTVATGYAHSLTRRQMNSARFKRPFHGVRVPAMMTAGQEFAAQKADLTRAVDEVQELVRAFLPLLPQRGVFSHETALLLAGCPIRVSPSPLHVSVPQEFSPPRRRGVKGHRYKSGLVPTGSGVVVPLPLALAQCARTLPLRELVVAMDHLLCPRGWSRTPLTNPEALLAQLQRLHVPGAHRARAAFKHSRPGAESRMETLLRLRLIEHGFTRLELQVELRDGEGFVGRFDLVDRERGIIFEYEGSNTARTAPSM